MTIFRSMISIYSLLLLLLTACAENVSDTNPTDPPVEEVNLSEQNLLRAMELTDKAVSAHFTGAGMAMARYYNPYTDVRSDEIGSVWMYSAAIEAVNAVLHGLHAQKENGNAAIHDEHFDRYSELLGKLYDNADYYLGTFELVSYTQTKEWSVYGVNRGNAKGTAKVEGIENVYDDQMWLIRELLESYKVTGNSVYLQKAEYLTEYVLDGWDSTRNPDGTERGGIPWGPGYVSKHACSNGPMVSPLVWLHELYKDKNDEIAYRYIDGEDKESRKAIEVKKSDYYADFAKKVYDWQKSQLLRADGVYDDMRGGCSPGSPQTETIDGIVYRRGITCQDRVGPAISYNSGTMLSGAADLYRITGDNKFLEDAKKLSDASFQYFAKLGQTTPGYYTYDISGFRNWFNGVLMRGYVDVHPSYGNVADYIDSFQKNLDYGYDNFLYEGFLPTNLLVGWSLDNNNNRTEGMFNFTFAAEYAVLSRYEQEK
ncbi:putative alpha-1,6-mannanase (GH76 family) [Algoriphagus sp. 4150]|uniref:glycoside hydrolase family 76 protein n=1 Tax=Algoriphagus sp. 4150 TaxID=2817756 RepID=UPI00285D0B02|nr:glycoside hydrolase family 76 protein [Algoriphagus sp. 4150]MDR7128947.1 putative alpha-1,6-mannanase (GH76 family) [Algoriphagus sp. 4150]